MDISLAPETLIRAYCNGIFPMAEGKNTDKIFWISPEIRGVIPLNNFHISKSLRRSIVKRDYKIISGGTENHCMLIDLRNKNITGKDAENALVRADITANKNMVPFDTQSPFITSGIRLGTPAITTRGIKEDVIPTIVNLIDRVIMNYEDEAVLSEVRKEVNELMSTYPIFA